MPIPFELSARNREYGERIIRLELYIERVKMYLLEGYITPRLDPNVMKVYRRTLKILDRYCPSFHRRLRTPREMIEGLMREDISIPAVAVISPVERILRQLNLGIWENHQCRLCPEDTGAKNQRGS